MLEFEGYPRFEGRFAEYLGSRLSLFPMGLVASGNAARLPRSLVVRFVATTIRSCAVWWLDQAEPCAPGEIAEMTKALLLEGLL
jgi:hypothetical protein